MYRVGPLARLNICERMGVPRGDAELRAFKQMGRGAVTSSFLYHYARLIEVLAAIEHVERALEDPGPVRAPTFGPTRASTRCAASARARPRAARSSTTTPWTAPASLRR